MYFCKKIVALVTYKSFFSFLFILTVSTHTLAKTEIESVKENADTTIVVPPNGKESSHGVTIINPDSTRTLTVNLRCIQTQELGKVELEGSTTFFRFTVENVTKDCPGFEIHATFDSPSEPESTYQIGITTSGVSPQAATDPAVFIFNSVTGNWAEAQGGGKPSEPGEAFATLTESYNKVIAGVISYPDVLGQNPTSLTPESLLTAIDSPDPTSGFRRINPPSANSQGTVSLDFPLMLRPARSPSPEIKINYSSTRGIGLLGQGWDVSISEIAVETVSPVFSTQIETEDYVFNGHLLFPLDTAGKFRTPLKRGGILRARNSDGVREYRMRDIGSGLIFRRHGTNPTDYYWEIYDPHTGQTSIYGATKVVAPDLSIGDLNVDNAAVEYGGNEVFNSPSENNPISRWLLTQVFDNQPVANETIYTYVERCAANLEEHEKIKCVGLDHVPLLDMVVYNRIIKPPADAVSSTGSIDWADGITTIDFDYLGRAPIRKKTHGRYGALISNQAFLTEVEVSYNSSRTGGHVIYSQHHFNLDDGRAKELNFRHHLKHIVVRANEDASLFPVVARPATSSYTDDLRTQVYSFSYKKSQVSPVWQKETGIFGFDPCQFDSDIDIERPRILGDLLGQDSLGEVTCPSPLGTTLSEDIGGSIHIAAGTDTDVTSKLNTVGVKLSITDSESIGQSSIVDINGDGLPDFVFLSTSNQMHYCPGEREKSSIFKLNTQQSFNEGLFSPNEVLGTRFNPQCFPIFEGEQGKIPLGEFSESSSFTFSVTPEIHTAENNFSGVNFSQTKNKTTTYLSDVDGDGLLDLVDNMRVFYNLGESKNNSENPARSIRFALNTPLIPALPSSDEVTLPDSSDFAPPYLEEAVESALSDKNDLEEQLARFPRVEPTLMWRAPESGFVSVNGLISEIPVDTSVLIFLENEANKRNCAAGIVDSEFRILTVASMTETGLCFSTPSRLLERFSPLNQQQINNILAGNNNIVNGSTMQPGDGDSLIFRVEENDVLQLVVTGEGVEKTVSNFNVHYHIIDWDETFNADREQIASPFTSASLALRAPATNFNPGKNSSLVSGLNRSIELSDDWLEVDFRTSFQFDRIRPTISLDTVDVNGQTVESLTLQAATLPSFCTEVTRANQITVVTCQIDDVDEEFGNRNFQVSVTENVRSAESELVWISPPHFRFQNPSSTPTGPENDTLRYNLALPPSLGDQIDEVNRVNRLLVPIPVRNQRFLKHKQRIDNEVFFEPIGRVDFLEDEYFRNVTEERLAENEALDKICANFAVIVKALGDVVSEEPLFGGGQICENSNQNNYTIDLSGVNEGMLVDLRERVRTILTGEFRLFYDQAIVSQSGFRLPVSTDPVSDCGGDDLCTYSVRLNFRNTVSLPSVVDQNGMLIPLNFNLRVRLFVDGVLRKFIGSPDTDQVIAISNGDTPPLNPLLFQASPGQLMYLEVIAEPLPGESIHEPLLLAINNGVFGTSEALLSTNTGTDGYETFMCRDSSSPDNLTPDKKIRDQLGNCKIQYRGPFRLQIPVLVSDAPQQIVDGFSSGTINSDLVTLGMEQSPTFTFDKHGWAIPYLGAESSFNTTNQVQFPSLNIVQNQQCGNAVNNITVDPTRDDVPNENPLAIECAVTVDPGNLVSAQQVKLPLFVDSNDPSPSTEVSYSDLPSSKVNHELWAWGYSVEDPDLVAFREPSRKHLFHMYAGRVGPDERIRENLQKIDEILDDLNDLANSGNSISASYGNGVDNRLRGRPSAAGDHFAPLHAPIQTSSSRTLSATIPITPIATAMISERKTTANFLDINGDGYPEFVGESGSSTMSSPVGVPRPLWFKAFAKSGLSESVSDGYGFQQNGLAFSANLGVGAAPPTAGQLLTRLINLITPGDVEGNFSVSADISVGGGFNSRNIAFADFNGDGLVDPYTERDLDSALQVGLNVGGRTNGGSDFDDQIGNVQQAIFERFGTLSSTGFGINLGYTNGNNSLSGGVGTGFQASGSYFSFMDFTADGLVDLVLPINNHLVIVPNLGNGYDASLIKIHKIPGFTFNQSSATESVHTDIGGNVTGGVTALGLKATVTVGVKDAQSYSRTLVQIRDLNADGVPDLAQERSFFQGIDPLVGLPPILDDFFTGLPDIGDPTGELEVFYNPDGQVGLLSSVTQPTGGVLRLDYALTGNSGPEHGQSVWSLARVENEDTYKPSQPQVSPDDSEEFPSDGDDVAGQIYRYHQGHYNRAEKTFYGFSQVLKDDYGKDCFQNTDCTSAPVTLLRRTAQKFDNNNYFSRGSLLTELIGDPFPLRRTVLGFDTQGISKTQKAYSVFDFSCSLPINDCVRDTDAPWTVDTEFDFLQQFPDLHVKEIGDPNGKEDQDIFSRLKSNDPADPLSLSAVEQTVKDLQDNSIFVGSREYEHAFDSYLGSNRPRLSMLSIYGDDVTMSLPAEPDPGFSPFSAEPARVVSAQGRDLDQWGQTVTFYDIGRVTQDNEIPEEEIVRSLRAEIKYSALETREQNEKTRFPLLSRSGSLRVTRGLEPREPIFAEDNFLRSRQATYQNVTGNLQEICLFDADVRPTMCREYVEGLDASNEADPQDRVRVALSSVAIEGEHLIHTRVASYDDFGNVTKTFSPLNHNGEWLTRNFQYDGDPFRTTPSLVSLTRCLRPPMHGASTPGTGLTPVCEYGTENSQNSGANALKPILHRSLSVIDEHFGGEAVSVDINNNALLTERDRWGRSILVARSFGDFNSGSQRLQHAIERAMLRHNLPEAGVWNPVLELEYIAKQRFTDQDLKKALKDATPNELPTQASESFFRVRNFKYVGGEFYRGLEGRARTLGAIVSYSISGSEGKTIQTLQESEVCLSPYLDITRKPSVSANAYKSAETRFQSFSLGEVQSEHSVIGHIDNSGIPEKQQEFAQAARSSEICTDYDEFIVQPGSAQDALGRELATFETYSGSRTKNDDHLFQKGFTHGLTLKLFSPFKRQKLTLLPLQSTVYDAANRPLQTTQRLGRLALHSQQNPPTAVLKAAARTLQKDDILEQSSNQDGGFIESSQFSYRIRNSQLDGGHVFSSTQMNPRCAISRTTFDARGLVRRVSQRHDKFIIEDLTTESGKQEVFFQILDEKLGNEVRLLEAGRLAENLRREKKLEKDVVVSIPNSVFQSIRDLGVRLTLRDGSEISTLGLNKKDLGSINFRNPSYDLTSCSSLEPSLWSFEPTMKETVASDGSDTRKQACSVNSESDGDLGSDCAAQAVSYRYDALRQLSQVVLPKPGRLSQTEQANQTLGSIFLKYDGFGRRTSIDDVNTGLSKYNYDDLNNVVSETSSRPASSGTVTIKRYHYTGDRLKKIEYQSAFDQNAGGDLVSREDTADTVLFFHDAVVNNKATINELLTDSAAADWIHGEITTTGCTNCIGKISMIKDRAGLKTQSYNTLGQVVWEARSIVHPYSRISADQELDLEIGRFSQKNLYTSFGDLVAIDLDDLKPSRPSENCILNEAYICGGRINLTYKHTPDGKLADIRFANGNQQIQKIAYDGLSRPYLRLSGDLTRSHIHFDAIDLQTNYLQTRTAVGSFVQNLSFNYERGGNVIGYLNAIPAYGSANSSVPPISRPFAPSALDYSSNFTFEYDTANRLTHVKAPVMPYGQSGTSLNSEGVYWYDDSNRFFLRALEIKHEDRTSISRKWKYNYPVGDNSSPKHAPHRISVSLNTHGPDFSAWYGLPELREKIRKYRNQSNLLGTILSTSFDDLGRLNTVATREISNGDPEEQALTPRQLYWDAEDRLRRARIRLRSQQLDSDKFDTDPTGEVSKRSVGFPESCVDTDADSSATRIECTVEDIYTYDFGSNRTVKLSQWPRNSEEDRNENSDSLTLYVTPFYARNYENRGTVLINNGFGALASIDMPYGNSASAPGVTYIYSDLSVNNSNAAVRTLGEAGITIPDISRREYSPYGYSLSPNRIAKLPEQKFSERPNGQSHLYSFHGKELDASSGFSSFGARYYSRDLGIWLSADPMLEDTFSANHLGTAVVSRFLFTSANPVGITDTTGLRGEEAANWAKNQVGSSEYQERDPHPEVRGFKSGLLLGGRGAFKCNCFVADALSAGGDPVSYQPKEWYAGRRIPVVNEWRNSESDIPGYVPATGTEPQLGDIVVSGDHMGIYVPKNGEPATVSAASENMGDRVVHNDFGFRKGSKPSLWRHISDYRVRDKEMEEFLNKTPEYGHYGDFNWGFD